MCLYKMLLSCHKEVFVFLQKDLGKTYLLNNPRQRINIQILLSRVDLNFHSQVSL